MLHAAKTLKARDELGYRGTHIRVLALQKDIGALRNEGPMGRSTAKEAHTRGRAGEP